VENKFQQFIKETSIPHQRHTRNPFVAVVVTQLVIRGSFPLCWPADGRWENPLSAVPALPGLNCWRLWVHRFTTVRTPFWLKKEKGKLDLACPPLTELIW